MNQSSGRLYSFDCLRGLAAFAIILHHYTSWAFGVHSGNTLFGKRGIYGVSVFNMLSDLALFQVYNNSLSFTKQSVELFYLKKFFRIFPLLWLVTYPIIWGCIKYFSENLVWLDERYWILIHFSIITSIVASWFGFIYYERTFIRLCNSIIKRLHS